MLKYAAICLGLSVVAAFAYVRMVPVRTDRFHVDPETAERPSAKGHILVRNGADIEPVPSEVTRAALAQKVEQVILATPRTVKLVGDLSESHASYVTRSGLWGFPDVASVKVIENGDRTASVLILSRQVYGIEDLGVNKARVENWLSQF